MSDIENPEHYAPIGGVRPIDVTEHLPHCLACAIEYLWRAGRKPGQDAATDYTKAAWHLARQIHLGAVEAPVVAAAMARKVLRDGKDDERLRGALLTLLSCVAGGEVSTATMGDAIRACKTYAKAGAS